MAKRGKRGKRAHQLPSNLTPDSNPDTNEPNVADDNLQQNLEPQMGQELGALSGSSLAPSVSGAALADSPQHSTYFEMGGDPQPGTSAAMNPRPKDGGKRKRAPFTNVRLMETEMSEPIPFHMMGVGRSDYRTGSQRTNDLIAHAANYESPSGAGAMTGEYDKEFEMGQHSQYILSFQQGLGARAPNDDLMAMPPTSSYEMGASSMTGLEMQSDQYGDSVLQSEHHADLTMGSGQNEAPIMGTGKNARPKGFEDCDNPQEFQEYGNSPVLRQYRGPSTSRENPDPSKPRQLLDDSHSAPGQHDCPSGSRFVQQDAGPFRSGKQERFSRSGQPDSSTLSQRKSDGSRMQSGQSYGPLMGTGQRRGPSMIATSNPNLTFGTPSGVHVLAAPMSNSATGRRAQSDAMPDPMSIMPHHLWPMQQIAMIRVAHLQFYAALHASLLPGPFGAPFFYRRFGPLNPMVASTLMMLEANMSSMVVNNAWAIQYLPSYLHPLVSPPIMNPPRYVFAPRMRAVTSWNAQPGQGVRPSSSAPSAATMRREENMPPVQEAQFELQGFQRSLEAEALEAEALEAASLGSYQESELMESNFEEFGQDEEEDAGEQSEEPPASRRGMAEQARERYSRGGGGKGKFSKRYRP